MRHKLSIFVMLLVVWSCTAPILLSAAGADTRACCRRNGDHHCAATPIEASSDSGTSIGATMAQCPCSGQLTTSNVVCEPQATALLTGALSSGTLAFDLSVQAPVSRRLSANAQRGPPVLL